MSARWWWIVLLGACANDPSGGDDETEGTNASSGATASEGGPSPSGSGTEPTTNEPTTNEPTTSEPTTNEPTTSDTSGPSTTDPSAGTSSGGPIGSAGCGMADPPSGELTIDVDGMQGSYVLSLPASYDPDSPLPLGFAFHGAGRTGPQCQQGDCAGFQSAMENEAVLVYMTSLGGPGWTDDIDLNVAFFEAVLDQVLASSCIDESLVFTAGTSSGAHFVNILGCRLGDRIAAIAPVAGVLFGTDCGDSTAALVIHGVDDPSFDGGVEARDFWRTQNGCSDVTVPTIEEVHADVTATDESHACAVYQDCDAGLPVVWCEHSEGGYDGSTHGWPLFGGDQIWAFVSGLS